MATAAEIRQHGLPIKVQRFVDCLLAGRQPNNAARTAGFDNPAASAVVLLAREDVQAAIMKEAELRLVGDGVPAAIRLLIGIVRNKKKPDKLRKECAIAILDRAGIVPPKAPDAPGGAPVPVQDMSREKLLELVNRAQKTLADRAVQVVDAPQTITQRTRKASDILA